MKYKKLIALLICFSMIISGLVVVRADEKQPFAEVDFSGLTSGFEYNKDYTADEMTNIYQNDIKSYGSGSVYRLVKDAEKGTSLQMYPSANNTGGGVIMQFPETITCGRLEVDMSVKMLGTSALVRHMLLPRISNSTSRYTLAYTTSFKRNSSNNDTDSTIVHFQPSKDESGYYHLACVITSPDNNSVWKFEVYDKTNIAAGPFFTQEFVRTSDGSKRAVISQLVGLYLAGSWAASTTYGDGTNGIELNRAVAYKSDVPKLVSVGEYDEAGKSVSLIFDKAVSIEDATAKISPSAAATVSKGLTDKEVVLTFADGVPTDGTYSVNLSGIGYAESNYGVSYDFDFYGYVSGSGLLKSVDYNTYEAKTYTKTELEELDSALTYSAKGKYEICDINNNANGLKISNTADSKGGSLLVAFGEQITSGRIQIDADVKMVNAEGSNGIKRNLFRPKGSGSPYTVYYNTKFVETAKDNNKSGEFSANKPSNSDGFYRLSCVITADDETSDWQYALYDKDTSLTEPFYTMTIPRAVNDTVTTTSGVLSYIDSVYITDIWFESGNSADDYISIGNVSVFKTADGKISSVSEFDNESNSLEIGFNTPVEIGKNTKITAFDSNANEMFAEILQTSSRKITVSFPWGMPQNGTVSINIENINYCKSDFGMSETIEAENVLQDEKCITNAVFTDSDGNRIYNLDEIAELNLTFDSKGFAQNTIYAATFSEGVLQDVQTKSIKNTDNSIKVAVNGADEVKFFVWDEKNSPEFKPVSISCTENGESALLPLSVQGNFYTADNNAAVCINGNNKIVARARLTASEAPESLLATLMLIRNGETKMLESRNIDFESNVADVAIELETSDFSEGDMLKFVISDSDDVYFEKYLYYDDPQYTIDILMVAGQSNALGQGADKTLSIKPEKGTVYFNTMGNTQLSDSGDIGWTGALGKTWHDRTGHTVLIVKAAWGGTGFEIKSSNYGLWSPDATKEDLALCHANANHCYADAKLRYNNAVASIQSYLAAGYKIGECVYFWCQGENENSSYDAKQYKDAFVEMHERIKDEFGTVATRLTKVGILPIRKKSTSTTVSTSLAITGPRAAQAYLVNTRQDVIMASTATENWYSDASIKTWFEEKYSDGGYPNGDMPTSVSTIWSDGVHYQQKAYNEFGEEAATTMLDYIGQTKECNGISLIGQDGIKHYEDGAEILLPETTVVPLLNLSSGAETATYTLTGNAAEMTEYNEITAKAACQNDYSVLTVTLSSGKTMSFKLYSPIVDESVSIASVKDNRSAIYTLTTDDNYKYTNEYLDDKFEELDLVGTMGLIADSLGKDGKLTIADAQSLVNTGRWGVANHTKAHKQGTFASLSDAELDVEINGGRDILLGYFPDQKILSMYTPGGITSEKIINKVKEKHIILRRAGGGNNTLPITLERMLNLQVRPVGTTYGTTAEAMNGWVDTAITNGQWLCEMWHGIGDDASSWGGDIGEEYTDAHLEYVKEKMNEGLLWVTTLDEAGIYSYQKALTKISKISETDTHLKISITDELDDTVFDSELTINIVLPEDWRGAAVSSGTATLKSDLKDGVLSFNAIHDIGEVIITKTN